MSKGKILNQWQRDNISFLSPIIVASLRAGDWRHAPIGMLRCVACGKHVLSGRILEYYQFRGDTLRCYQCQKLIPNKPYEQFSNSGYQAQYNNAPTAIAFNSAGSTNR